MKTINWDCEACPHLKDDNECGAKHLYNEVDKLLNYIEEQTGWVHTFVWDRSQPKIGCEEALPFLREKATLLSL